MTWRDWQRSVLVSALVVLTGLCTSSGPVRAQVPATQPTLVLLTNQPAFGPGAGLSVTLGLQHAGPPVAADLYFGAILPDGDTVVFFEGLGLASRQGRLSNLASIRPMIPGLAVATGTNIVVPDFFRYTWQGNEPQGTYQLFFAATTPGALRDGQVQGGELLAMKTQSILNLPPATITTDAGHAGSAEVGPGGGTVVTTAADGTIYTLTVPRGALGAPTTITLTPVTSLTGLPVPVNLAAGVRGSPSGLRFALPATLVVDLPQPLVGDAVGMPMPDSGAGFDLVPVARNGTRLTMPMEHFSIIAIPNSSGDLLGLVASTSRYARAGQLIVIAAADLNNPSVPDAQAALDYLTAWFLNDLAPDAFIASDAAASDEQRLAWLAEFYAWDDRRSALEGLVGSVVINGAPIRGRLTAAATSGRQMAVTILGAGYGSVNAQCQVFVGAVTQRLRLAARASRFAVLTELYLEWLQENQANPADVDQAAAPNREAAGVGIQQIPATYCLRELIAAAEPDLPPGGTGQLRVTAGAIFGSEPTAFGDFMEVGFQPDPPGFTGYGTEPTSAQGDAFFPVTADQNGTIRYRVCAHFRGEFKDVGLISALYRADGFNCRSSVTGVVVTPSQTEIMPGQSRQFTAVVEGTANQAVTWSVTGGGTITQNGLFASNGTLGTFFVTATSVEDPNSVGIAQVTVTLPCVDETCTYSGTWTRCEERPGVPTICDDFTGVFTNPQASIFPQTEGPASIAVFFTCPRSFGSTFMDGRIELNGAFTASQISGSNVCVLGSMTGTLTPDSLNFTIVNAFNANMTFTFSGTR